MHVWLYNGRPPTTTFILQKATNYVQYTQKRDSMLGLPLSHPSLSPAHSLHVFVFGCRKFVILPVSGTKLALVSVSVRVCVSVCLLESGRGGRRMGLLGCQDYR